MEKQRDIGVGAHRLLMVMSWVDKIVKKTWCLPSISRGIDIRARGYW